MNSVQTQIIEREEEKFIVQSLERLNDSYSLNSSESYKIMDYILEGKLSPIHLSAILTSFRLNDITSEEIAGLSQSMLDHAVKIKYSGLNPLIDIVGTGGAKFKTFNVSSTASLVMPLLGVAVAKHGNRTSTAKSGSADMLEALGIDIQMEPIQAENCLNRLDLTFMFAPSYHPSMKNVIPVRKELKIKTIFNLLGPLVNPASVRRQMTGVFSHYLLVPVINCFKLREFERVAVFYNNLGADEIIQIGTTTVYELRDNSIITYQLNADDFGVSTCSLLDLHNRSSSETAKKVVETLSGIHSSLSDFVAINMAMGLRISGIEEDLKIGTQMALDVLDTGKALDLLQEFIKLSGGNSEKLDTLINQVI